MATSTSPLLSPLLLLLFLLSAFSVAESHRRDCHDRHTHLAAAQLQRRQLQDGVSVASLADEAGPWNGFKPLLNAKLGDVRAGVASLKTYLKRFGYIDASLAPPAGANFTDTFDNVTQNAVTQYQRSFGLTVTGSLDIATLTRMIVPRCGREDVVNGTLLMLQNGVSPNATGTQHWSAFPGNPRWEKQSLTYAVDATALSPRISLDDTQTTMDQAFATWAAETSLTFTRVADVSGADISVYFRSGDHGDTNSFDGQFGVLAHAFSPSDGRLHFDADEAWSLDVNAPTGVDNFDLLSVAVHEIGHLLGLEHSGDAGAIMYPSISSLEEKRALSADDVAGVQTLYGVNANPTPAGNGSDGEVGDQSAAAAASWRRARARGVCGVAAVTALWLVLVPG